MSTLNPGVIRYNNQNYVAMPSVQFPATTVGGKVSLYLTDDGTSTGNPLYVNGIYNAVGRPNDSTILAASSWAMVGNLLTVTITKHVASGVTILGISAIGTDTVSNVPDGTPVLISAYGLGNAVI